MSIRGILGAAALVVFMSGVAKADTVTTPQYNWTGGYAGAYAGYDFASSHIFDNEITTNSTDFNKRYNLSGVIIGAQAGWNKQVGNFVIGLVGDAGYNGASSPTPWPFGTSSVGKVDIDTSLRLRAGLAKDRTLLYITGGPALGHVVADYYDTGGRHDNVSGWAFGYTAGGGLDFALKNHWVVGGEIRYTEYASVKGSTTTTDSFWYESNAIHETSLRLTLSKRF